MERGFVRAGGHVTGRWREGAGDSRDRECDRDTGAGQTFPACGIGATRGTAGIRQVRPYRGGLDQERDDGLGVTLSTSHGESVVVPPSSSTAPPGPLFVPHQLSITVVVPSAQNAVVYRYRSGRTHCESASVKDRSAKGGCRAPGEGGRGYTIDDGSRAVVIDRTAGAAAAGAAHPEKVEEVMEVMVPPVIDRTAAAEANAAAGDLYTQRRWRR